MPEQAVPSDGAEIRVGSDEDEPRGDVYTMAEAARLKGVSYHTVSRAVRRGKLPVRRLGRMALIETDDLRAWQPMRQRAPYKYRRREPMPDATPALLDFASGERVALARQLSTLYEVIHGAATELPLPSFLELLSDRISSALGFKRVAIWGVDEDRRIATRLATFGPLFSSLPDEMPVEKMPVLNRVLDLPQARLFENLAPFDVEEMIERYNVTVLFGAPLRVGNRLLGAVLGDCVGEPFHLTPEQLSLAQVLANQAALALEQAHLRADEASRTDGSKPRAARQEPRGNATSRTLSGGWDTEQLGSLDRAKDEFLSVVAHELRNPLTSLRGNLQLMARRIQRANNPGRAEEMERFETILAQTDRMAELVNRLLDVSRADMDKFDLAFASTDAVALVRAAAANVRGVAKERSIDVEAPAKLPVVWDQVRIEQVLANLLSNAIKYAPEGAIEVNVESTGEEVRISVRDHGPGVEDAFKARLFERYYRAPRENAVGEASGSQAAEGLGLGLYISRKIVDGHGGTLSVSDADGGGAVFTLTLPRDASRH
ncbi:MAG: ATP-binding protein [Chloroflexota bacterium]|nr:ATP-binding protein [Chloroflexota bacterium]